MINTFKGIIGKYGLRKLLKYGVKKLMKDYLGLVYLYSPILMILIKKEAIIDYQIM